MDLPGITIGLISFLTAIFIAFMLLIKYDLNRTVILHLMLFCAVGHFIGGLAYYEFAIHSGADSLFYFNNATTNFHGIGYNFAFFVLGCLRKYLINDSLLGAFLFFASLGFLGSIFYLLTFKILLDKLSHQYNYFLLDAKILIVPATILLCWPSYFFWSAGLVKDNFAYVSIGFFLFFISEGKFSLPKIAILSLTSIMTFILRPYLFIIVGLTAIVYVLLNSKWNLYIKFSVLIFIACMTVIALPTVLEYGGFVHFNGSSFNDVAKYAVRQQSYMSIGSSIPVPTHNPRLMLFFLPYLMLANLFLPFIVGATNILGMISSVENLFLFYLVIFFFRNKIVWKLLKQQLPITKFIFNYFIVGLAFLSMMNTNMGLAMREKMMFVPGLLIVILLVYAYRRIIVFHNKYPEYIPNTSLNANLIKQQG